MKPASESPAASRNVAIPLDPSLAALLDRLGALSREPGFQAQLAAALGQALRPYAESACRLPILPLPEELALAELYLYADYFPTDGQLSLVEQVRDMIEVHVPQEERAWLDPLRHSYMDLLEILSLDRTSGTLVLRSLGDKREFTVEAGPFGAARQPGQVLLTRLIRLPDRPVMPGTALALSAAVARRVYDAANDRRRTMEAASGSFALGDWQEFAKGYGYVLLWLVAQSRLGTLLQTNARLRYRTAKGLPLLYALALYEHQAQRQLAQELDQWRTFRPDPDVGRTESQSAAWIQQEPDKQGTQTLVARLTLSRTQLTVEADSPERLDRLKHDLASTFGYAIHCRGENIEPPDHELPEVDLLTDRPPDLSVTVPIEEEQRLLEAFLDSIYLEWAERPAPALDGRTPRHAASDPAQRTKVASLIEQLEREDLARRRTGQPGYEYDRLRAHVGLPEVHV